MLVRILLLLTWSTTALAGDVIDELLRGTDDLMRGESSVASMELDVKTKRYERTMKMKVWSQGTERTLIRITAPAKDSGICTLKIEDNIWNYLPKVDRTMKVPAGMMSNSWMGSHFSNDDLVKESRLSDDFDAILSASPEKGDDHYLIVLTPKPDAAVVWGKIEVRISLEKLPEAMRYYEEDGTLVRTLAYSNVQEVAGRRIPMTMTLTPEGKGGEYTRVTYSELAFDMELPSETFTLQALR